MILTKLGIKKFFFFKNKNIKTLCISSRPGERECGQKGPECKKKLRPERGTYQSDKNLRWEGTNRTFFLLQNTAWRLVFPSYDRSKTWQEFYFIETDLVWKGKNPPKVNKGHSSEWPMCRTRNHYAAIPISPPPSVISLNIDLDLKYQFSLIPLQTLKMSPEFSFLIYFYGHKKVSGKGPKSTVLKFFIPTSIKKIRMYWEFGM